jgi:hypothetical protein
LAAVEGQLEVALVRQRSLEGENVRLRYALTRDESNAPVVPEILIRNVRPSELAALRRSFLAHADINVLGSDGWPIGKVDLDLIAPLLKAARGVDHDARGAAFEWPTGALRTFIVNRLNWGGGPLTFSDVLRVHAFACEHPEAMRTARELRDALAERDATITALEREGKALREEKSDYLGALVPKLRESHERLIMAQVIEDEARGAHDAVLAFERERAAWESERLALLQRVAKLEEDTARAEQVMEMVNEVERARSLPPTPQRGFE